MKKKCCYTLLFAIIWLILTVVPLLYLFPVPESIGKLSLLGMYFWGDVTISFLVLSVFFVVFYKVSKNNVLAVLGFYSFCMVICMLLFSPLIYTFVFNLRLRMLSEKFLSIEKPAQNYLKEKMIFPVNSSSIDNLLTKLGNGSFNSGLAKNCFYYQLYPTKEIGLKNDGFEAHVLIKEGYINFKYPENVLAVYSKSGNLDILSLYNTSFDLIEKNLYVNESKSRIIRY